MYLRALIDDAEALAPMKRSLKVNVKREIGDGGKDKLMNENLLSSNGPRPLRGEPTVKFFKPDDGGGSEDESK